MTSDRPYRRALERQDARAEIENGIGSQFCPRSARAFLAVLDQRP
jgi:HD-GYP domain-containing protein (c-di-GMP phosphodiesterase class II)